MTARRSWPCPACCGMGPGALVESCVVCDNTREISELQARRRIAGLYLRDRRLTMLDGAPLSLEVAANTLFAEGMLMADFRLEAIENGLARLTPGELRHLCRFYGITQVPMPHLLESLIDPMPL